MPPTAACGESGVIAIDFKVGEVTVRLVVPEIESSVAVIVVEPAATPVARPVLTMVAIEVLLEFQVQELVMLLVEPSL